MTPHRSPWRPTLSLADVVAAAAVGGLSWAVVAPVVGRLEPENSEQRAIDHLVDQLTPPEESLEAAVSRGLAFRYTPVAQPESAPPQVEPEPLPPPTLRSTETLSTGHVLGAVDTPAARLSLLRPTDGRGVRYRASVRALRRLAHTKASGLPSGVHPPTTPVQIPAVAGTEGWQAARDIVLDGFLPHPDTVSVDAFVAAATAGEVSTDGPSVVVATDPGDGGLWLRVHAAPALAPDLGERTDVVYVIDTSGSMAVSGALDEARAAMMELLRATPRDHRVAVIGFDTTPRTVAPFSRNIDIANVFDDLSALEADGATDAAAALALAAEALKKRRGRARHRPAHVVLFSDGDLQGSEPDAWSMQADALADAGVHLTTVALGQAWADGSALRAELETLGGEHLSCRDGLGAVEAVQRRLGHPAGGDAVQTATLTFDGAVVREWSSPSRDSRAASPVAEAARSADTILRVWTTEDVRGRSVGTLTTEAEKVVEITVPGGVSDASNTPQLALAAAAADLARALKAADPDALSHAADRIAASPPHPARASLLRVARRSAVLASIPVVLPGDRADLDPELTHLTTHLADTCFLDLAARRPEAHGEVTMRLRLRHGATAGVDVVEDRVADRMLEACLRRELQTWTAPGSLHADLVLPLTWTATSG